MENSDNKRQLCLKKKKPAWRFGLGMALFALGLLLLHVMTGVSTLQCERIEAEQGQCQFTRRKLFSQKTQTWPLKDFYQAGIAYDDEDTAMLYALFKSDDSYEADSVDIDGLGFGSTEAKDERQLEIIQEFRNNTDVSNLYVRYSDGLGGLFLAWPLLITGLLFLLFSGGYWVFIFDAQRQSFIVGSSGIWGSKTLERLRTYAFDDIQSMYVTEPSQDAEKRYDIELTLKIQGQTRMLQIPSYCFAHSRIKAHEFLDEIVAVLGRDPGRPDVVNSGQFAQVRIIDSGYSEHYYDMEVDLSTLPPGHEEIRFALPDGRHIYINPDSLRQGQQRVEIILPPET